MPVLVLIGEVLMKVIAFLLRRRAAAETDPEALVRKEAADMAKPAGTWKDTVDKL